MPNLITQDIPVVVSYTSTPGQTVFSYDFPIFEDTDLEVFSNGTLVGDYTLSGIGSPSGGDITFPTAFATGTLITVSRTVPIRRAVDLPATGPYSSEDIDLEQDRSFAIKQQLQAGIDRSIRFPIGPSIDPLPTERSNTLLGFDDDGAPVLVTQDNIFILFNSQFTDFGTNALNAAVVNDLGMNAGLTSAITDFGD